MRESIVQRRDKRAGEKKILGSIIDIMIILPIHPLYIGE